MPGISHTPSAQNVATASSVRPSSKACVYAASAARTPSTTSAYRVGSVMSEVDLDDGPLERVDVDGLQRGQQLLVRKPGEESVDRAVEVRDVTLHLLRQPHV